MPQHDVSDTDPSYVPQSEDGKQQDVHSSVSPETGIQVSPITPAQGRTSTPENRETANGTLRKTTTKDEFNPSA